VGLTSCTFSFARLSLFFFLTHPAPPVFSTLSLHDALPISSSDVRAGPRRGSVGRWPRRGPRSTPATTPPPTRLRAAIAGRSRVGDRKSTRLNSSHDQISYAVFCLKKKNRTATRSRPTRARR